MKEVIVKELVSGTVDLASRWLRRKQIIRCGGKAVVLYRLHRDEDVVKPHEQASDPAATHRLDNGKLEIRGQSSRFKADLILDDSTRSVVGKLVAKGRMHNGKAFMTYEVDDKEGGYFWCGVMMVYVTGCSDIEIHFLTESFNNPSHTNIGQIHLKHK